MNYVLNHPRSRLDVLNHSFRKVDALGERDEWCARFPDEARKTMSALDGSAGFFLAALDQAALVGYIAVSIGGRGQLAHGEIISLFVSQSRRCQGIGSQLVRLAQMEMEKRKCVSISVSVAPTNLEAQRIYARAGLVPEAIEMGQRVAMTAKAFDTAA